MADGFLIVYLAAIVLGIVVPAILGGLIYRRRRGRGAFIGLVLGVLFGPLAVNLAFFDSPFEEGRQGPLPVISSE